MTLDAARSQAAVQATIAGPLGIDVPQALARMLDAYAERLTDMLRPAVTAGATIAAFRGAGPMSVCAAARRAGVARVIIPRTARATARDLRLFLHHDSSYTATAEAMLMHKNSVKYRVESAEKILGHRIRSDRQAIELALTACHWLGRAVLRNP